ncbi:MAG: nucleotidyltransferase domain-containing protein [Minicystis sp.]
MSEERPIFDALEAKADRSFPNITAARRLTAATLDRLGGLFQQAVPSDTSVVVFGSLARGEYTEKSDVDWTLLIDGQADPAHHGAVRAITATLKREGFGEPGPTGVFGNVAVSHSILHQIGGQDDTNKLTTQRILLLLESRAIGREEALERVIKLVLSRYVEDDRGLLFGSKGDLVPRFLLNDIVRYWRTVTVDFVYKQRDREGGWALRNAKLKMSRKLIFVSGMLTCFGLLLFGEGEAFRDANGKPDAFRIVRFLRDRIRVQPLDHLAQAALRPAVSRETARALFEEYDAFLGVLRDQEKREHLKGLTFDDLGGDALFRETSRIGRRFQEALDKLFFVEDPELRRLILDYGVF